MNPYAPPGATDDPLPPQRPAGPPPKNNALTVIGAIAVVLGVLGLLGGPAAALIGMIARDPVSRRIHEITWSGDFGMWMRISVVLGTALSALLIAAGIGLMNAKPWARQASIVYGATTIVLATVNQILSYMVLFPELERIANEYGSNPVAQAGVMGGKIGGMVGGIAGLVFPVFILVSMFRPSIKEALAKRE
jgi:hypothetical protein